MPDTTPSMQSPVKPGPDYRETTSLPAVNVPASAMDAVLVELRALRAEGQETKAELSDKIDTLSQVVDNLQHDAKDTRLRIGRMEREIDEVKDRQASNSIRAKSTTEDNLKQDSAIATLVTDVAELKVSHQSLTQTQNKQLAILERLDKVAANPMVRRVAYAVGTAIIGWAVARGYLTR